MAFEISIVKNLDGNRVLISSQSGTKKKSVERLYIAPNDNADKFIKDIQAIESHTKFQKIMTGVLSVVIGLLVGSVIKFKTTGKILSGLATGTVSLSGGMSADKKSNATLQKNAMKNYNVEEITGQNLENFDKTD